MSTTHFLTLDTNEATAAVANMGAIQEGTAFYAFAEPPAAPVPMYRARHDARGTHLYTTFIDERDVALNELGYIGEGIGFWCWPPGSLEGLSPYTTPLYRFYDPFTDDYLYTVDPNESHTSHRAQGIAGYVYVQDVRQHVFAPATAVPLMRLLTPSGQHFCTANEAEYEDLLALNAGYTADGVAGYVFTASTNALQPLFRSYHPSTGGHLYTMDISESDKASQKYGYRGDGISGYIWRPGAQLAGAVALLRGYNATSDDHLYTVNAAELQGYSPEGTTGYVASNDLDPSTENAQPMQRLRGDFTRDFLLPVTDLVGNSNLLMTSYIGNLWNPIMGLAVDIEIQSDLTADGVTAGVGLGMSFQLNAQSPIGFNSKWQQYIITLQGGELSCEIQNWSATPSYSIGFIEGAAYLCSLGGDTIPAGYHLQIVLINDDYGNILGAGFSILQGTTIKGQATLLIQNLPSGPAFGAAPILGIQMVIVGPGNGSTATLAHGGAGIISYTADSPLYAQAWDPQGFSEVAQMTSTEEQSNVEYGPTASTKSKTLTQAFGVRVPTPK
jgi:hypothetical protein